MLKALFPKVEKDSYSLSLLSSLLLKLLTSTTSPPTPNPPAHWQAFSSEQDLGVRILSKAGPRTHCKTAARKDDGPGPFWYEKKVARVGVVGITVIICLVGPKIAATSIWECRRFRNNYPLPLCRL